MESPIEEFKRYDLKKLFKFELKFYKELSIICRHTKVYLNIPETIICGFGFKTPTLICTDYRTGEVMFNENLSKQAISEAFTLFASLETHGQGVPIAVCKSKYNSTYRDKAQVLFTPAECNYLWEYNCSQSKGQAIQKFIKNHATGICKSEYLTNSKIKTYLIRKDSDKNVNKSVILKKNAERLRFLIVGTDSVKKYPISAPTIYNKMMYLVYLIEKYYLKEYNIKILQLKCNWIEDQTGKAYLLNLKEYKIASNYKHSEPSSQVSKSNSLPMLSFVKKIKEAHKKSQISSIALGLLNWANI